jgi:hypothetical protein
MINLWNWFYPTRITNIKQSVNSDITIDGKIDDDPIFNLIFHFHCVRHEKVCYSIAKLEEHLSIFNGHKILTVSSPDNKFYDNLIFKLLVEKFANKENIHIIPVTNDNNTRETLHFFDKACPLLKYLLQANKQKNSYTFYGHSKGCTHAEKTYAITCWVNTLFKYNLDLFYNKIKPQLLTNKYKFIGCLKTIKGSVFEASFHYCGTFFWFNSNLIENNNYKTHDHKVGLEMWPGYMANDSECLSVFDLDNIEPYRYGYWYNLVDNRIIDRPITFSCDSIGGQL